MKIQDLLANLRGFMELVFMILGFFYKTYNKFKLNSYLFNRLVFLEGEENNFYENNKKDINMMVKHEKIMENNENFHSTMIAV
jgi:hypothetical protein